jgi:RNA polymerase sigma-70 factor (ECF subfamily)
MDTDSLLKRAKYGDKEALIKLIMDKKTEYYKLAYVYLQNREDSLDVMQDMIIIVYDQICNLRKDDAFYAWSKTILVNCCRKILKSRNKTTEINILVPSKEDMCCVEQGIDLKRGLESLNINQQEAIKLRYFLDLDYDTISKITGVPLGTVKSRISVGISKLKSYFGGEY